MTEPRDDASNRFAEEHRGFVASIAKRIKNEFDLRSIAMDDLMAFGFQGLFEAKGRFDETLKVKFTTFAYYRVRGAIIDGIRKMAYLPAHVHRLRKAAEAMDWALEDAGEQRAAATASGTPQPTPEQAIEQIDDVLGRITASFMIAAVGQDEASQPGDAQEALLSKEGTERVRAALELLPEREKIVVRGMYFEERSLDDIGAQLGISRSWACRLHTKGLKIMRKAMEKDE